MKIIPAIDLLGGNAVRLRKGVRDDVTVFSHEPWTLAAQFEAAGADRIHVVDLDGAFDGARKHARAIQRIMSECSADLQIGGGLRTREAVDSLLGTGANYAVLGTAAVEDPAMAEALCRDYPGQIIIGVDAKDGQVAVQGWVKTASITAIELGARAAGWGAAALLYTDVSRDGVHAGPNVEATAALAAAVPGVDVIASGGVSSLDDLRALAAAGIPYAIVGRALYDERFTLAEAIEAAAC